MKKYVLFIFMQAWCTLLYAQYVVPDTVAARFWQQAASFPQEKLYTQTDRAEYVTGDTIWMRHHIVDALTGMPSLASRYVYVELVNPVGQLVQRVMMRQDEHGIINGYVPTISVMPSGMYVLRAYTRYMADATPDYLFSRPLRLHSVMENSVRITPRFSGGKLNLSFTDLTTGHAVHNGSVSIKSSKGDVAFIGDTDRGIKIHSLDIGSKERCLLVQVGNYEEYVPLLRERIDLQLMPEGGHMVLGQRCRVAYKTVQSNGLGINMSAVVTDDRDSVVATSTAAHCGMGAFYVTPQKGRSYRITCTSEDGQTAGGTLPKALADVPALAVVQTSSNVIADIIQSDGSAKDALWLIVHQRGAPLYVRNVAQKTIAFSRKMFRDGVAHFVLADGEMNIISERVAFIWNGSDVLAADSDVAALPANGGALQVAVTLPDTVDANCAVSVTAVDGMCADTVQDIVSTLLLSQELRGYVEQPAWYFSGRGRMGLLDLLMLTQGWRRYDVQRTLRGEIASARTQPETSMHIAGKVTSDVSPRGKKGANVVLSSSRGGLTDAMATDDDGRFLFNGFEMPDSTGYMLMARSAKGSENVVLRIDEASFPIVGDDMPQQRVALVGSDTLALQKASDRIATGEGRTVFLPNVTITALRPPRTQYELLTRFGGTTIKREALSKEGYKGILAVLRNAGIAGLVYNSDREWFKYHGKEVILVVDGSVIGLQFATDGNIDTWSMVQAFMQSLTAKDVYQVDVVKGAAAATFTNDISRLSMDICAIVITTSRDYEPLHHTNVRLVHRLGYQRPAAFYNPKYDAPDDYMLRQTVYWNPAVQISGGKAEVQFLPNGAGEYRVRIEGVSSKGKIVNLEKTVK